MTASLRHQLKEMHNNAYNDAPPFFRGQRNFSASCDRPGQRIVPISHGNGRVSDVEHAWLQQEPKHQLACSFIRTALFCIVLLACLFLVVAFAGLGVLGAQQFTKMR